MPVASGRSAVIAFGRQTAEGTALTTPKFEIPMGGGFVGPVRETADLSWTQETQDNIGSYVQRNAGTIDVTLPVLPKSSVQLFQMVLGTLTTTGASAPYSHAITPADTLPWGTWFFAQPGTNYWQLTDAKVGSAQLSWSAGSPLELSVSGNGKTVTRSGTKWTAATTVEGVDPFFTFIGATMKVDHATTPAATTVRNIPSGSVTINRNLEAIQTDRVTDQFIAEQTREIEVSLDDVVFENNDFINSIFTGSASGTTMSSQVVYGSCDFTFIGSDEAATATRSLVISLPRVLWAIDQIPGADPAGAPVRYTITGRTSKPTSGSSITVTIKNDQAGTVY